jgi:uncharacterized phage-associated protein
MLIKLAYICKKDHIMPAPYSPHIIANYFIELSLQTGKELTPMKLVKLVYISHGWYLGLTNKPLIIEGVQAWKYGPVVTSVYHDFKHYGNQQITSMVISQSDIEFLNKIWDVYKDMNGLQLSTLTHQKDTPWDIVWNQKDGKKINGALIPNDIIKNHYKAKMNGTSKNI